MRLVELERVGNVFVFVFGSFEIRSERNYKSNAQPIPPLAFPTRFFSAEREMLGCFSRLRRPPSTFPPLTKPSSNVAAAAAAADHSTAVFKSFNSLFEPSSDSDTRAPSSSQTLTVTSSSAAAADPDLISSAIASRRLFPASPGQSNSILDSPAVIISLGSAGIAVPTYTPDPYSDFRRSMEEMAAAIGVSGCGTQLDLAVLRELLLCYLGLNRKQAHKYIVSAFADLLVSLSGDEKGFGHE